MTSIKMCRRKFKNSDRVDCKIFAFKVRETSFFYVAQVDFMALNLYELSNFAL